MAHKVLVIGGAGYIGSHMVRCLRDAGDEPVVFDNLSTGHRRFLPANVRFIKGDLNQYSQICSALRKEKFSAVMHFAASSLVGESVQNPLKYYKNNVAAFVNLLEAMIQSRVRRIIFSSTAAVFGEPEEVPIKESAVKKPTNPYGRSKLMIEQMLADAFKSYGIQYAVLRYFNAAGAHEAGGIGERHHPETHLIPILMNTLLGVHSKPLTIFGSDYPTADGTCIRDYIHVDDLCDAHKLALDWLFSREESGDFNLGSGKGYSILDIVREAEKVTGKKVPVKKGPRRAGDPSTLVASSAKARAVLKWRPRRKLSDILSTAWQWHQHEHSKGHHT